VYSIKAVSQATGLSIETLRAWERRYRIVIPHRDPNGRRSYRPEDVVRLRKLREATGRGHPISKLARLSDDEVGRLLDDPAINGARRAATHNFAAQILEAAGDFRPADCDQLLAMALALLPLQQAVVEVIAPLMREVGDRWHRGEFSIAQERIVSMVVRKQVASVLDTYNRIATGPLMVLTTPAGERHELGILMCALVAASRNVRCHYLGTDLPAAEIATYATRVHADVVVLSLVMSADPGVITAELSQLAQFLPERIELWGGGTALERLAPGSVPERLRHMSGLDTFDQEISLLTARLAH
jgi:DNA-binding transcriptional MerR regulator